MSNTIFGHGPASNGWKGKAIALIAAAAIGIGGFALPATATAAETPIVSTQGASQEDTPFDYYAGIEGLPADHVFENITLERLEDILANGTGKYAILIGGTWDPQFAKALPGIDKAAKAQGIKKVYNFDPHLDNAGADTLVDVNDRNNKVEAFAKRFQTTVDTYKLGAIQSKDPSKVVDLPTLFTYDKDASGDNKVLAYAGAGSVTDATALDGVLATAKNAAVRTNGDFYVTHYSPDRGAGSVFKTGEEKDIRLVSVTYGELEKILKSEGNHFIFFGATWCPNTEATIRYVNSEAEKYGVDHVYTFDTILDNTSGKGSPFHIRDSYGDGGHPLADLYTHLVNTYLPNLVTEDTGKFIVDSKGNAANRLQVPLLLHYNKDNAEQLPGTDQPAGPITDEVVDYHGAKYNVDTKPQPTAREYMLSWWGTTYDDAKLGEFNYHILTGDDLSTAKNFGRNVTNDRDAYVAQLDHFYSVIEARGAIAAAEAKIATGLDGVDATKAEAYKNAVAAAKAKLVKGAPIDGDNGTASIVASLNAAEGELNGNGQNNGGQNQNNGQNNNGQNQNNGGQNQNNDGQNQNAGNGKDNAGNAGNTGSVDKASGQLSNTGSGIVLPAISVAGLLALAAVSLVASRRARVTRASGDARINAGK